MEKLIVFLFIIIFGIIRTLIEKSAENKAQRNRPQPPQAAGNHKERLQSELEAFLSEVSGKKPNTDRPAAASTARTATTNRESAGTRNYNQPASSAQNSPPARQRAKQKDPRRPRPVAAAETSSARSSGSGRSATSTNSPRERSSESVFGSSSSGVNDHVKEYIGQHVEQHMRNQISDYVQADMNGGTVAAVAPEPPRPGNRAAADLVTKLRSPEGMRQAILINEVLSRPRALRR